MARQVGAVWSALERHDAAPVLERLAQPFEHRVFGDHALAGSRHVRPAQQAWFERIFRLIPDIRYTVIDVLVAGWPWRTRVIAVVEVHSASHPGYSNTVIQQLELHWTRVARIVNLEDTQALVGLLMEIAQAGQPEALAPPIDDHNWAQAAAPTP